MLVLQYGLKVICYNTQLMYWHHAFLAIILFHLLYFIGNYVLRIFRFQKLMKLSDEYSYYVYLVHMIWIIGPFLCWNCVLMGG